MPAVLFGLMLVGGYVVYAGATGRSPSAILRARLTGGPDPERRPSPLDVATGGTGGGGTGPYEPPGPVTDPDRKPETPTGCSGREMPGTRRLWNTVVGRWPQVKFGGIYNCRKVAGGGRWSRHAEGRAVDIMVGHLADAERIRVGDEVAAWLVANADTWGIEELVWNGRSWTPPRRTWQALSNPRDHWNHVHAGQSRGAAAQ